MNTLEIDSVNLSFGERRILSDIYIKIETGTITGLMGRNGSGKSCLLKIILGTLKPYYSSIRINSVVLQKLYQHPGLITYIPQFDTLPSHLNTDTLIKYLNCTEDVYMIEIVNQLLKTKISKMSGGQRRMIQTLLLLHTKSRFILLDEPFSHLSPVQTEKISEIIKEKSAQKGILITDHLYNEIMAISDKLVLLQNGKTYTINSKEDLVDRGYLNFA
ncbi:ATP-binding cassette domain-containing protein [Solitalea koreensis]|nr:ATP-binding cassette domain-containing protein [Solitalea koreensis]